MKPFDIVQWQAPGWQQPHPAVIVSHPDRANRKDPVEVILCSTQRAGRTPEAHEIILDVADGLNWATLCKCDLIYAVPRAELKPQIGRVSAERQAHLIRTLIAAHYWGSVF
jgi:mRNA-degrading endonuclease toxin of MazEF toxin-antitoxin module